MIGTSTSSVKLLCSYGGIIIPSFQDHNKLRYYGGHTRVLSVDRSIPFAELMLKLEELCGSASVSSIRCQLPSEDLDALVSITCNADFLNLMEEYDKVAATSCSSSSPKVRMFLSQLQPRTLKKEWPPHSPSSTSYRPSCYDSSLSYHSSRYNQSGITSSFCHAKPSYRNTARQTEALHRLQRTQVD